MGAWLPDEKHHPARNSVTSSPPFHQQAGTRRHALGRARTERKRKGRKGKQDQRRGGRELNGGEEEGGGRKSEKMGDKERW